MTKLTAEPAVGLVFCNQPNLATCHTLCIWFFHNMEMNVSPNETTILSEYIKIIILWALRLPLIKAKLLKAIRHKFIEKKLPIHYNVNN